MRYAILYSSISSSLSSRLSQSTIHMEETYTICKETATVFYEISSRLTSTDDFMDFDTSQLLISIETREYNFVNSLQGYLEVVLLSSSKAKRMKVCRTPRPSNCFRYEECQKTHVMTSVQSQADKVKQVKIDRQGLQG